MDQSFKYMVVLAAMAAAFMCVTCDSSDENLERAQIIDQAFEVTASPGLDIQNKNADEANSRVIVSQPSAASTLDVFNSNIDCWIHASILTVDEANSTIFVYGRQMPYAMAYTQMMREIAARTAVAIIGDRVAIEMAVRKSWEDRLNAAKLELPDDNYYTFSITTQESLRLVDEKYASNIAFLDHDADFIAPEISISEHTNGMHAVSVGSMRAGDAIMLGYKNLDMPRARKALLIIKEHAPSLRGQRMLERDSRAEVIEDLNFADLIEEYVPSETVLQKQTSARENGKKQNL